MSIQKVVDALNAAFAADPGAMRAMMINRVPCNMALANDPYVVVEEDRNLAGDHFNVGMLGVINGVLAAAGMPLVAAKWDMREDGPNIFAGFIAYIHPKPVCVADQSPQPDQYWQHKTSGDRAYFIGRTPDGEMVWQCEGDPVEVGNLDWSGWEYLPGCDSWEWKPVAVAVEEFPQYWTTIDAHCDPGAYIVRFDESSYRVMNKDGTLNTHVFTWCQKEDARRTQITKAQAEALEIHKPKPVAKPAVIKYPQWYVPVKSKLTVDTRIRIAYFRHDSAQTGETFLVNGESFTFDSISSTPIELEVVTEAEAKSRVNPPAVKEPSDVMGQSPDDWVPLDEKYDECLLLPGYQFRRCASNTDWRTIGEYDSIRGQLIKDERYNASGDWEFRCLRKDLPVINVRIPVTLYWYDGAIVGRYADSPVTDPSFVPIHSDNNGGWFIERSTNAGN